MAEIKIDETYLERWIKIKWRRFDVLLITSATWIHLDCPSKIQQVRLNRNDSQS